ncbi:MAG: oligopeptide transporter, OPT family [Proteobacteria bacterium]|nr:oligopeptide transporter, OPT family [Pseudomonadota bacterium]
MAGDTDLKKTLPPAAYEPIPEGGRYEPIVGDDVVLPELTARALIIGVFIGVVFGAANAYLGLKVGLTVSASIPAAVIGVAVFKALRSGSILEVNLVQTVGSAGESLAAGVIFTLPVLYLWGYEPGFWPIFPLAMLGGLLGVFFMIPLRRFLIVQEHGRLSYPEGTACAEVLVASQAGGNSARLLFQGMVFGGIYAALEKFGHLWPEEPDVAVDSAGYRTSVGATVSPELLGVGFIIGPKVAAVMLAGGAVGWLFLIPLIYAFGGMADVPIAPVSGTGPFAEDSELLIRNMGSFTVWSKYLRYVGAGAVAFGGLFTLLKSTPVIVRSFKLAIEAMAEGAAEQVRRTEHELSLGVVGAALAVIGLLAAFLPLRADDGGTVGIVAGFAVVLFSFFFVTVSSRIVGLIGSSSNPISGMTIATVLVCALLFGGSGGRVAVLTIGALVCIAAAIAGDTSQDLKTGFLVGATPRNQQMAEVVGVIAAAAAMSTVLALFRDQIVSGEFKAPQANLIQLVIDGVLDGNLPWVLVISGAAMAFAVEIMGLPTLAFAVGLYLPIHLAVPIMAGGLIRLAVDYNRKEVVEELRERGVLVASGMIAGAALIGVANASLAFFELEAKLPLPDALAPITANPASAAVAFSALAGLFAASIWGGSRKPAGQ